MPTESLLPVKGVQFVSPPSEILERATAIITEAAKRLPAGKSGAIVGLATLDGMNAAIVQRLGDHLEIVGWIAKRWSEPLEAGSAVRISW